MPGLGTSACLDPSAIKNKYGPGGRSFAPEANVDSVLAIVGLQSRSLRRGAPRLDALPLRQAWLPKPRPPSPRGLALARRREPIGQRICA